MIRGVLVAAALAAALGCRAAAPAPEPAPSPSAVSAPSKLTIRLKTGQVLEDVTILHFGSDVIRVRFIVEGGVVEADYPRYIIDDPRFYKPYAR